MRLPPEPKFGMPQRSALVNLFQQVDFHPLSIGLLAQQLKERRPAELGERLEALLEEQPADREDRSLLASLELSLERLPERCREWLPRLGVFAGGGLEEIVVKVAGLEEYPSEWSILRHHLNLSGLMQAQQLQEANKIWLRFHPTLAPALWQKLGKEEQAELMEHYYRTYHQLVKYLYKLDDTSPNVARIAVQSELPNLLRAVYAALQKNLAEDGVDFTDKVNLFLNNFGLRRDYQALAKAAAEVGGTVVSQTWFLAQFNLGNHLLQHGQITEAGNIFQGILANLGDVSSYNRWVALHMLGRCYRAQGQVTQSEQLYRHALAELTQLEQSEQVQQQINAAANDLADVLTDQGRYREAETIYQTGLEAMTELRDTRSVAVILGQRGRLALEQDLLDEAAKRYQEALDLFRSLNEPISESTVWHQLGQVYQEEKRWAAAEQAYRTAAQLKVDKGLLEGSNGVCATWDELAQLCFFTDRPVEAERWYCKALKVRRDTGDRPGMAITLSNLALLLLNGPGRLHEARQFAEEGLAIDKTLDPTLTEIWNTYELLAQIAAQQGETRQAAEYRAKSRQAYLAFPDWRQQLHQHDKLIAMVVQANTVRDLREKLEQRLNEMAGGPRANLITAIQRILSGERDETVLYESLDWEAAGIILAILEEIERAA
ncbi:MAG: tetratricopeptide repeat protein [Candidatus Electrothrix sp. AU1_5]|nr:tetratricopeptide repeat protein [Candidatus Electrothrix gigas]